jgi:DnaJ-like protein C11, C-terminal
MKPYFTDLTADRVKHKQAALLGFYDPSPGARKHLKIDYLFHGAIHTTDVGDFSQVVLPLRGASHQTNIGASTDSDDEQHTWRSELTRGRAKRQCGPSRVNRHHSIDA